MARDLNDIWGWIKRLVRRIERLESGAFLESSSITKGRMRFIGGTLRIDSGGKAEIVGTLQVDGSTIVTGTFRLEGAWTFTGNGSISGNVNITGKLTQNGPWEFVGAGQIKGNVDVTGTIRVLAGGKIQVGTIVIDPSISGGAITFANGAQVFTDGTTIQVYKGNSVVQISDVYARLQNGGDVISIGTDGVRVTGMATRTRALANNAVVGSVWTDGSYFYRVVP